MKTVADVKRKRFTDKSVSNISALALALSMRFAGRHIQLLSILASKLYCTLRGPADLYCN